jgi:5-methylcytosine-specific restriction endonuclease McrA
MTATVAELINNVAAVERERAARAAEHDKFAAFYRSRKWRAARYAFMKVQPRPLRCRCCGSTAADIRLCVDHIEPIKKNWARRNDPSNYQLLCNDCNLAKASSDTTDWRSDAPSSDAGGEGNNNGG